MINLEQMLLVQVFNFNVCPPTRYEFAQRFATLARFDESEKALTSFLIELSLFDYNLNYFKPSHVAAAALHLTIQMCRHREEEVWTPSLAAHTRARESELVDIVVRLRRLHWERDNARVKNIIDKYSAEELHHVAEKCAVGYPGLRFGPTVSLPKRVGRAALHCYRNTTVQ